MTRSRISGIFPERGFESRDFLGREAGGAGVFLGMSLTERIESNRIRRREFALLTSTGTTRRIKSSLIRYESLRAFSFVESTFDFLPRP